MHLVDGVPSDTRCQRLGGVLLARLPKHADIPADRDGAQGKRIHFSFPALDFRSHADGKLQNRDLARPGDQIVPQFVNGDQQPENQQRDQNRDD